MEAADERVKQKRPVSSPLDRIYGFIYTLEVTLSQLVSETSSAQLDAVKTQQLCYILHFAFRPQKTDSAVLDILFSLSVICHPLCPIARLTAGFAAPPPHHHLAGIIHHVLHPPSFPFTRVLSSFSDQFLNREL